MCDWKLISLLLLVTAQIFSTAEARDIVRAAPVELKTGNYIIALSEGTNQSRFDDIVEEVISTGSIIYSKVNGDFAKIITANLTEETLRKFSELDDVEFIEEETYATAAASGGISWALDRINQQSNKELDGYSNSEGDGQGVHIYLLDSGINYEHCEFGGRAAFSGHDPVDVIKGTSKKGRDCSGHGTHIASVAAGATSGVASKAKIYSVRVLDCDNKMSWSAVIDGLNHVGEKIASLKNKYPSAVVLMPLSGPVSLVLDHTILKLLSQNIPIVAAVGNNDGNACHMSPSSTPGVITVSASTNLDKPLPNTNAGPCVDIFAPGDSVIGANYSCNECTCTSIRTGTSISAALVAGVVSLYLQESPHLSPSEVRDKLLNTCTRNALNLNFLPYRFVGSTNNCLLYTSAISSVGRKMGFINPTQVVMKTVTVSVHTSPTPETVCCQTLRSLGSFEDSLGNLVEREMYKAALLLQDNITSLFSSATTQPPPSSSEITGRKGFRQKVYKNGTAVGSCSDLRQYLYLESGYYPILMQTGDEVMVYCDLDKEIKGRKGFMRIVNINMSNPNTDCPNGLLLRRDGDLRTCQRGQQHAGCSATQFSTSGVQYSRVCGRIRGYQWASPNAFFASYRIQRKITMIDEPYVDGVILTYKEDDVRKHIWTFAAAADEIDRTRTFYGCPCTNKYSKNPQTIPSFINEDYFCETGTRNTFKFNTFYTDDPLWDGKGCGEVSTCCDKGEWFCKDVPKTSSDIELRLCGNEPRSNEDTPLELIELYVQ